MRVLAFVALLMLAAPARASLIGVSFDGYVWTLAPVALTAARIASSGLAEPNALARRSDGALFTIGNQEVYVPDHGGMYVTVKVLAEIDPQTGLAQPVNETAFTNWIGLAFSADDTLYGIQRFTGSTTQLWKIDPTTGNTTSVGSTPFVSLTSLEFSPDGRLYAWQVFKGLVEIDPLSGTAVRITQGPDQLIQINSLAFTPGGGLIGVGQEVFDIDVSTGVAVSRGALVSTPPGFVDIRGIAFWPVPEPSSLWLLLLAGLGALGPASPRSRARA
ncbi:MAG: PEP-CTERM sorting domain-containing protein [Myxococcota bacterium]